MSIVITEEMKELARRLIPAIRHKKSGKVTTGRRGEYHAEILHKAHPNHSFEGHLTDHAMEIMRGHDRGFYDTKHKKFMTRDEASDHAGVLDSQDLVPHKHTGGSSKTAMFREGTSPKKKKSFKEIRTAIQEGNPLSRMAKHIDSGRSIVAISAERTNNPSNHGRMKELKSKLKAQGYGFKKAKGVWEGGSEHSLIVHAKDKGPKGTAQLVKDMRKHASDYDQDAILHYHKKTGGQLIGTNSTGFPGKKKVVRIGKIHYNVDKAKDHTQMTKDSNFRMDE